jgi:TonB family protein
MRRTIILASIALHAGLVFAFLVAGLWRLERVEAGRITVAIGVPLPPPPAPSGGASPSNAPKITRKEPPKHIIHTLTQLPEVKPPDTKPADTVATTGTGEGSGEGSGGGSGDKTDTGTCTENCGPGGGSGSATVTGGTKKTVEMVPPTVLRGMRIAGETQIHPSDVVKTSMLHEGHARSVSVFKTCVGANGQVASVSMLKSSGYAEYDQQLVAALRDWQYKPYEIGGVAVPVCGIVTFQYEIK